MSKKKIEEIVVTWCCRGSVDVGRKRLKNACIVGLRFSWGQVDCIIPAELLFEIIKKTKSTTIITSEGAANLSFSANRTFVKLEDLALKRRNIIIKKF